MKGLVIAAALILASADGMAADTGADPAAVQAYRDAAQRQAEFEVSAFQAGSAARAAWFKCVADALPKFAPAHEPATAILRDSMGVCEAAEETALRRWTLAGNPALAHKFRAEAHQAMAKRFLPLILKFKAGGYGPVPK